MIRWFDFIPAIILADMMSHTVMKLFSEQHEWYMIIYYSFGVYGGYVIWKWWMSYRIKLENEVDARKKS